jgi:hypothetical protein
MNLLLAAAATLTLALAGVGLLRIVWPTIRQVPPMARLALGFCAGCFLEAGVFFIALVAGASFSQWLALGPIIGFGVLGAVAMAGDRWSRPRFSLAVFMAVCLGLLALALSWDRPVYGYDALSMWALKAKVAFFEKTWPTTLFDPHTTSHPDYPPLVPVAQTYVFFYLNRFDDVASRVIFAAFFASGAAILWWWLGVLRVGTRGVWLLWWCALPVIMEQVKINYADMPLAVFLVVFYGAVVSWLRAPNRTVAAGFSLRGEDAPVKGAATGKSVLLGALREVPHEGRGWLALAAIFGGMAFWVKQDALIGIGGGFFALILVAWWRRLPLRPVLMAAVTTVAIALPWRLFLWTKHYRTDFGFPDPHWGPRAVLVAKALFRYALIEGNYAFFWPLFVVVLVFCARRLRKTENLWLLTALVIETGVLFGVYLCAAVDLDALLNTSMERLLMNLFVPALLLVAWLWPGSFVFLRRANWQRWGAAGVMLLLVAMFWIGLHRRSDQEAVGIAISPFPLRLSWMWMAIAGVTLLKFIPRLKQGGIRLAWQATRFAIVMATFGLAAISMGVFAHDAGEIHRRFSGKTLEQQHAMGLDPAVRERLASARKEFPAGTHVALVPRRSRRYHEFYYEAYPDLIVDNSVKPVVDLDASP